MKKILCLFFCLLLVACSKPEVEKTDGIKFKELYESLNGKYDDYGNLYKELEISEENPIVFGSYEDVNKVMDGTGIVLFAFPECPWCRKTLPVFLEALEEAKIRQVYYLNNKEDRNEIKIEEGKPIVEKEGTSEYLSLLERLKDVAEVYTFEDYEDKNLKRIYFPTILVVKDGKILFYHTSTVDSDTDAYTPLSENQRKELKDLFVKALNQYKNACPIDGKGC